MFTLSSYIVCILISVEGTGTQEGVRVCGSDVERTVGAGGGQVEAYIERARSEGV